MYAYPSKIKVRLVMSTDAVIDHLELLGGVHVQTCHIRRALYYGSNHLVLLRFQPGGLANPVVGCLQSAGNGILYSCPPESRTCHPFNQFNFTVVHGIVIDHNVGLLVSLLQLQGAQAQEGHIIGYITAP